MRVLVRIAVVAAIFVACITVFQLGSSSAQIPDEFKNLKVLPKDISKRDLTATMRSFTDALGVKCSECHEPKAGSDEMDFSSDKKPEKEAARKMMRMVAMINEQIGKDFKDPPQVRCVTCHHGLKEPETLASALQREIGKNGVDGAVGRYRTLRDQYYGSGAYDFSPDVLVRVAGDQAEGKKDFDGAIKLLQLNLEFSPKDADTYAMLGRVYLSKGDKAAAITNLEKALELDPNNRWAKQQLERAKSGQ